MTFRLFSLVVWLAFSLTVPVPVDAQEGGHTGSAKPPQTGSVMPVPDTLTGSRQAAVRVWGVVQTVQPYAAAFLVTHNRTGKYVSALQLKWLLFDLKTDRLLEEGRATARRLPVSIVESLREKSRLEDFVNLLGTSDYGLPLEPFRKKYPDTALKLVFVVEQAQLLGGETWSREIVPTFPNEPETSGYCPNQRCEAVTDANGNLAGFRCDDFNARGLRCENHGTYCAIYPCQSLQPQGLNQGMGRPLCDTQGGTSSCEDWWAIFP